jgi:hypothetical protein
MTGTGAILSMCGQEERGLTFPGYIGAKKAFIGLQQRPVGVRREAIPVDDGETRV